MRKAWALLPAWPLTAKRISMLVIAVELSSRSVAIVRYSYSRRLNRVSRLTTWPLIRLGNLFVTGPTTSSFDTVYKIDRHGAVSTFFRGLGRPQGLAFDKDSNLYVAASLAGKRGIVRDRPRQKSSAAGSRFEPSRAGICSGAISGVGDDRRSASFIVGHSRAAAHPGSRVVIVPSAYSFTL